VGVGDVVCPAPGAEWEVLSIIDPHDGTSDLFVSIGRGGDVRESTVQKPRPVYILDRVTAAAERDGVDPAEVAAGVLTSGGLAPSSLPAMCGTRYLNNLTCTLAPGHEPPHGHARETVTPPGQTGAAILHSCQECGALTYPSATEIHASWHEASRPESQ
jgi:hypothetical protein